MMRNMLREPLWSAPEVNKMSETKCGLCDGYLVSDVSAIELVTTAVANNNGSTNGLDEQTILDCEGYAEGVCNDNLLCPDCAYRLNKD
jgi:hypothetical protein